MRYVITAIFLLLISCQVNSPREESGGQFRHDHPPTAAAPGMNETPGGITGSGRDSTIPETASAPVQKDQHERQAYPPTAYEATSAGETILFEKTLDFILALSSDPDWKMRRFAAYALRFLKDDRTLETLEKLARDSNWSVREMAIRAIGPYRVPKSIALLQQSLSDPIWRVRLAACQGLAALEDSTIADALLPLINDPDADVRSTAIAALAELCDASMFPELMRRLDESDYRWYVGYSPSDLERDTTTAAGESKPRSEVISKVIDLIRRYGQPDDAKFLEPVLNSEDLHERLNAATAIIEVSGKATPLPTQVLLESLYRLGAKDSSLRKSDLHEYLRRVSGGEDSFIARLCAGGEETVQQILLSYGQDHKESAFVNFQASDVAGVSDVVDGVFRGIFDYVSDSGDASLIPVLWSFYDNAGNRMELRTRAIEAAAVAGDFAAQEQILRRIVKADVGTEIKLIQVMARSGCEKRSALLLELLNDRNSHLNLELIGLVPQFCRDNAFEVLVDVIARKGGSSEQCRALSTLLAVPVAHMQCTANAQRLLADLYYERPVGDYVRPLIIRNLSRLAGEEYISLYKDALSDKDKIVRTEAISALSRFPGKCLPCLITALQRENDDDVIVELLWVLGRINAREAVSTVQTLVKKGRTSRVRNEAFRVLVRIDGETAKQVALASLDDDDRVLRVNCLAFLGRSGDLNLLERFIEMMHEDTSAEVRIQAARAISMLKGVSSAAWRDEFIKRLESDESDIVRMEVINLLADLDDATLVPVFERVLRNDVSEKVRFAAGAALASWGSDEAKGIFLQFLTEGSKLEQRWALAALGEYPIEDEQITAAIERLSRQDRELSVAAINALASSFKEESLKQLLTHIAESNDALSRIAAIEAIISMRIEVLFPLMAEMLRDELMKIGITEQGELDLTIANAFRTSYYLSRFEEKLLLELLEKTSHPHFVWSARLRLAHGYGERFEFRRAAEQYAELAKMEYPNSIQREVMRAYEKLCRVMVFFQEGHEGPLDEEVHNIIRTVPIEYAGELYNFVAWYLTEMGIHLEKALEFGELALRYNPENENILDTIGWTLYKLGKYEESLAYLTEAVFRDRGTTALLDYHKALTQARLGRIREAMRLLKRAMRNDSELQQVFENSEERKLFEDLFE